MEGSCSLFIPVIVAFMKIHKVRPNNVYHFGLLFRYSLLRNCHWLCKISDERELSEYRRPLNVLELRWAADCSLSPIIQCVKHSTMCCLLWLWRPVTRSVTGSIPQTENSRPSAFEQNTFRLPPLHSDICKVSLVNEYQYNWRSDLNEITCLNKRFFFFFLLTKSGRDKFHRGIRSHEGDTSRNSQQFDIKMLTSAPAIRHQSFKQNIC